MPRRQYMGMPMSSYAALLNLEKVGTSTGSRARDFLDKFNLFVFVIHDPVMHPDFDAYLNSNFKLLHESTDNKLLFCALIKPSGQFPQNWFNDWSNQQNPFDLSNAITPRDASITAFALANALSIPAENLPCIAVARGFQFDEFYWVNSSADKISSQLNELGRIALSAGPDALEHPTIEKFNKVKLESSLAKTISGVLDFVYATMGNNARFRMQAVKRTKETLAKIKFKIHDLKSQVTELAFDHIDALNVWMASLLAHESIRPPDNICANMEFPNVQTEILYCEAIAQNNYEQQEEYQDSGMMALQNREFLEQNSYFCLRTGDQCLKSLSQQDDVEFSCVVTSLAKAFETEINLSIVHWIRERLGIELPKYFNIYQQDKSALVIPNIPNPREINFNMNSNQKWRPPGIGESHLAFRKYGSASGPMELTNLKWDVLDQAWNTIKYLRNRAAHTEEIGIENARSIYKLMNQLFDNNLFQDLYSMKRKYRGY